MKFYEKIVRDSQRKANEWWDYFKELYAPLENDDFDSSFKQSISNKFEEIMIQANSTIEGDVIISENDIEDATRLCKKGKACGEDNIFYKHILYGGVLVCKILSKLFTAMFKLSHTPDKMKKGIIITLYKGGKKRKEDTKNYRAITLSSVILKLYERILLSRIESHSDYVSKIDSLQVAFRNR